MKFSDSGTLLNYRTMEYRAANLTGAYLLYIYHVDWSLRRPSIEDSTGDMEDVERSEFKRGG
jgi:hypothetical protein